VSEHVFFSGDAKDKNSFKYKMPANPALEITKYHEYIATIPGTDSPEIFGLDLNADLTFRMN
jgi:dynein heavy chain